MEPKNYSYNRDTDLLELVGIFWRYKILIVGATSLLTTLAIAYLYLLPNPSERKTETEYGFHYKTMASLYFPTKEQDKESKLGRVAMRIAKSNKIFEELTQKHNIYNDPYLQNVLRKTNHLAKENALFEEMLIVKNDNGTDLVDISFHHPKKDVAIDSLKSILSLTIKELKKLNTEQPFHVIKEPQLVGGIVLKYGLKGSKRGLYVIIVFTLALISSFVLALGLNFLSQLKKDPRALRKIKGNS